MAFLMPIAVQGLKFGLDAVDNNHKDQEFRSSWTQQQLGPLSSANPGKNIMIICVKHDAGQLQDSVHQDLTCTCPSGHSQHYDVYIFDSGIFLLQGDGGYLNWAFCGNFTRDGSKVTFKKLGT